MKKILFAAMAATILFASCAKDDNGGTENMARLTVKITGLDSGTRAIEAPGTEIATTINYSASKIFIINALGKVISYENLVASAATPTGQELAQLVPSDSRVYIVCNSDAGFNAINFSTIDQIKDAVSALSTQTDYTKAALANSTGAPKGIVLGPEVSGTTTASVDITISPLISRMELTQIKGGTNITSFDVIGVYVDDHYPNFTYGGSYDGTIHKQGQSTTFTTIPTEFKNEGSWSSNTKIAAPASSQVWAYQVASESLPRFIIALTNVKYMNGSTPVDRGTEKFYLTVKGYTSGGTDLAAFERGKIYRIGGGNGIEFDEDDLGSTPNPTNVKLTVKVDIEEWEIKDLGVTLM